MKAVAYTLHMPAKWQTGLQRCFSKQFLRYDWQTAGAPGVEERRTLVGVGLIFRVPAMLVAGVSRETSGCATAICIGALVVAPIARGVEVGRLRVHVGGVGGGLGGPAILVVLAHAGWQASWSSICHLQHMMLP